jgi:hypothetical protein
MAVLIQMPAAERMIFALEKFLVTEMPTRSFFPETIRLTAALRFACCAGPICWIGYQY